MGGRLHRRAVIFVMIVINRRKCQTWFYSLKAGASAGINLLLTIIETVGWDLNLMVFEFTRRTEINALRAWSNQLCTDYDFKREI